MEGQAHFTPFFPWSMDLSEAWLTNCSFHFYSNHIEKTKLRLRQSVDDMCLSYHPFSVVEARPLSVFLSQHVLVLGVSFAEVKSVNKWEMKGLAHFTDFTSIIGYDNRDSSNFTLKSGIVVYWMVLGLEMKSNLTWSGNPPHDWRWKDCISLPMIRLSHLS